MTVNYVKSRFGLRMFVGMRSNVRLMVVAVVAVAVLASCGSSGKKADDGDGSKIVRLSAGTEVVKDGVVEWPLTVTNGTGSVSAIKVNVAIPYRVGWMGVTIEGSKAPMLCRLSKVGYRIARCTLPPIPAGTSKKLMVAVTPMGDSKNAEGRMVQVSLQVPGDPSCNGRFTDDPAAAATSGDRCRQSLLVGG